MKLISNWKTAYRFLSVQAAVIGGALMAGAQAAQAAGIDLPEGVTKWVGYLTVAGVVLGRLVRQGEETAL